VTSQKDFVRRALTSPGSVATLTLRDWDVLIRQGRAAGMLARICYVLEQAAVLSSVPDLPRRHLIAARKIAANEKRIVTWEARCIHQALRGVGTRIVLLKGAAYVFADLPVAQGRTMSDVDILVPRDRLKDVEAALLEHGWKNLKVEEYDNRFYREWSHELPPLMHTQRETVIDVHHNILPSTGRLHPDADKLLEASQEIPGTKYRRLSDEDMVLHAAAHMFQDGDLARGLRELVDIDGLVRTFSAPGFWERLCRRAPEMDLQRPLFYSLRYCRLHLATPIPDAVASEIQRWAPGNTTVRAMDRLVAKALEPRYGETSGSGAALWMLYIRSHWLRMPPGLLARHLAHQSMRRVRGSS
jgi:hypothetical protein